MGGVTDGFDRDSGNRRQDPRLPTLSTAGTNAGAHYIGSETGTKKGSATRPYTEVTSQLLDRPQITHGDNRVN